MSSIGEKIKEALTGHSHKDSTDANTTSETTPRSYPSDEKKVIEGQTNLSKLGHHHHNDNEIGAGHTQGRHDPEVDAKEATSQAGNYPYWGDIPREGEQGHTQQSGTSALGGSHAGDSHNLQKSSALAAGGLATGAGTTAASRHSEYEHRPLGTQDTTSTSQNLTDRTRDTGLTSSTQDPSNTQTSRDGHKGEIAAVTGAGLAGATYLGTRHKDEDNKSKYNDTTGTTTTSGLASGPTQAGPGSLDPGYASQTGSSTSRPQEVSNSAFGDTRYGTQDNTSHRKEEGALAAGAAGLGGAGYLAHKHQGDQSRTGEQPTTTTGSQQRAFGLTPSENDNSYSNTRGDNSHLERDAALAGAGAAGLGGAGYLAHKHNEDQTRANERPTTVHSSQQRDSTTTGGGIHNTVIGAGSPEDSHPRTHKAAFDSSPLSSSNTTTVGPQYGTGNVDPREQQTISSSLGAPSSGNDREKQGLAAAAGVGAGAGVVAAEEKHRHNHHEHRQHDDDQSKNQGHSVLGGSSGHHHTHDKHNQPTQAATSTTNTASQPSAQLAAQQAWNKQNQNQTSSATGRLDPETEARQATSAAGNYPYEGQDRTTSSNVSGQQQHHHNSAALGAAGAGLAGAGATAAYYGQGREHDQNPRSDESQKIADRALGSDGGAYAPSSSQGQSQSQTRGLTGASSSSTPGYGQSSTGLSAGSGLGSSKVLHKCHQCGADNDISDYFKKDATFRSGA